MNFLQSPIAQHVISGLIGFCVSALFFFLGKKRKRLKYSVYSTALITNTIPDIPGLSISLHGQPIENLTMTKVIFENIGNQNIESSDFALSSPLHIVTDGKFFDSAQSLTVKSKDGLDSSFDARYQSEQEILISFDFVKPKQDFSIYLLHSGTLSVTGTLKSGKTISDDFLNKYEKFRDNIRSYSTALMWISCIGTFTISLIEVLNLAPIPTVSINPVFIFLFLNIASGLISISSLPLSSFSRYFSEF